MSANKAIAVRSIDSQWPKWASIKPSSPTKWFDTEEEARRDARLFNDRYGLISKSKPKSNQVREYACVKCQSRHTETVDPLFDQHLMYQDKHGWYWTTTEAA